MKYYIPVLVILALIASILFFPSVKRSQNVSILEADIPSCFVLINDYIYYVGMDEDLHKISKASLNEVDHLHIPGSRGLEYSEYHDMIMVAAPGESSTIHLIDYEQMTINDSICVDYTVVGMDISDGNLYLICDESGLMEDDMYSISDLDSHSGRLVEYRLSDMRLKWEVPVGTIPDRFDICDDFIVVSADEHDLIVDDENEAYMNAKIVDVVNRSTLEVNEFIVGLNITTHIECGANGKVYVSNPHYVYEYFVEPGYGMSIIDLNSMDMEHVQLLHPLADDNGFAASATQIVGDDLYMSFFKGAADPDRTYFGIYDLITEELEVIEIPEVDQYLFYLVVDGDSVYFLTTDGWLIKYTME